MRLGIMFDPDPSPGDPISISRSEFDDVWGQLSGWRANYDTVLLALADVTVAPYAPGSPIVQHKVA